MGQGRVVVAVATVGLGLACAMVGRHVANHDALVTTLQNAPGRDLASFAPGLNAALRGMASNVVATALGVAAIVGLVTAQGSRTGREAAPPATPVDALLPALRAVAFALALAALAWPLLSILATPVPAGVTASSAIAVADLALLSVSGWMAGHAIHRGWDMGETRPLSAFACLFVTYLAVLALPLVAYGYLAAPFERHLLPDSVASGSFLHVLPFAWAPLAAGAPRPVVEAISLAACAATLWGSACLVSADPLGRGVDHAEADQGDEAPAEEAAAA